MASSTFFRYSLIKNKKFKEGVFTGEDTIFINNFLLLNPLLGLCREAIYFYRKRADSTSAVQNAVKNEEYYFSIIKSVDEYLIQKSKLLYNKIQPFIQFYLSYSILFRISFPAFKFLEDNKLSKYFGLIQNILEQIDDKYILEQKVLTLKEKFAALSKKYNKDLRENIILENNIFLYSGNIILNRTRTRDILVWRMVYIRDNILHLEGKDNCILKKNKYFYFCKLGKIIYYPKYYYFSIYDWTTMYGNHEKGRMIEFKIPLLNIKYQVPQFYLSYKGIVIEIFTSLGWFSHIPSVFNSYYISGNYIFKYNEGRLNIFQYNKYLKELCESKYCEQLNKLKKKEIIKIRNNYFKYEKLIKEKKTQIWIINDKQNLARDNGEFFFRYLKKINSKKINFYFAIKKNCDDFERLSPLGDVLDLGSENYLNTFLRADKIISSVYEDWAYNPFKKDRKYIIDLLNFDFIYIQHGIIKDDFSRYINRITKNFSLIVSSAEKEYKSLLEGKYHYNHNNIILTGLPRFDNIQKLKTIIKKEKLILIFPTWRMDLKSAFDSNTHESIYTLSFKSTNYFKFYNNLINDEQLLINMKDLDYKGILCIHPYFSKQWKDFKQNEIFSVKEFCDYQDILLKASLLITDYSSIFFDFAYLQKPIIYSQFDYKDYRKNHYQKSYFEYKKDGFGKVCFDFNCTIKEIIIKMKSNCLIENKYLKRIRRFFKYKDDKNSERLYLTLINKYYPYNNDNIIFNNFINIFLHIFLLIKLLNTIKHQY